MLPERVNMSQQSTSELVVYITHVEPDDIYLKIWAQMDKQAATAIEQYIFPLIEQFNQGYGCPSKTNRLMVGSLCCARFRTEGYYRAKIVSVRPDGMIVVQFIDYGNMEALSLNDIHLLDNIRGAEPLQAYPAMATEFTLLNVLPVNGVWDNRTIESIKKSLCYNEYRALVQMMNNHCLIKLWYNNEDFSELLVKERMALPATLQDMFRPKHTPQSRMLQQIPYQQQNKGNANNFATMPMMQNPNHNANVQGMYHKTFSSNVNQPKHIAQPILQHPPPPPPIQEALVFKSRVLEVGSRHDVFISHVEDGPQKFSIQVESARDVLTCLMTEINNHPKKPLQEPPLPGSVCLGRYKDPGGERVLCRAVVMSVMEHKCKLYYVDFGHTEILPYTDIFQLPPEYINPKVLSIRFTLSGLKELIITQEMKEYFKELVYRRLLILHVRPPEGPPLIQYGDLYDNGVNVKDLLKKAFPEPAAMVPITYSYPQLRRLTKDFQEVVYVSYVESCKKFFVQLDSGVKSLESIMAGLTQYAKTASTLNIAQLKAGQPCAALYDSQWYRAQILSIVGDKVKVVYVDYGNEEIVSVISLRVIHDDLVTKLPAQAIQCALNGYEVLSLDQEVSNHFERLTLEKRFYMKVVAAQPNGLLVDLFEFDTMRSVHPQLLNNLFCDKTENSTSSRNEEVQHSVKNEFQSEDKDKYNKRNNMDSWNRNQNAKPFQDNKSSNWRDESSQEKQYDNRRERSGTYSYRDNSQNDRFIRDKPTNSRFDREKSYNKCDESDGNSFNRDSFNRGTSRDNVINRFSGNERRYNRYNSDKNSDKDSDTSSKDNDRRGKGGFKRNDFNDNRGGNRNGGASDRWQTSNWNDKKPSYKANYRNDKFNGDNSNNRFRKEDNTSDVTYNQTTECESWKRNNPNNGLQDNITVSKKSELMKIDITLGSMKNCELVFLNSPLDFFIQLSPECLELNSVMERIAAIYENGGDTMQASEIQSGTYCIAQYSEDLKWYRAVIKSVEESSATVEFVDYGNTELVNFMNIKVILEEFLQLPMQAVHCKLLGLTNVGNEEEQHAIFLEKTDGKSLQAEFVFEENEMYKVLLREVVDDGSNIKYINEEFCTIADLTKAKQIATNKKAFNTVTENRMVTKYAPSDSKWQTTLYEPESKHNIIVTWFINPNKLYCQLLSKETEFKTMMSEIQKIYINNSKPVTHKLEIGSAVIAIFSEDRAFYRAEVVNIDTLMDTYVIRYIDFGNCASVNRRNIYPVEKKFMQLPKLAVLCSLKDIGPNNNSNWSGMDNNALDACFNADKYECTFHSFNDDLYVISLNRNGQDVGSMLIQQNLAASTKIETVNKTSDIKEKEFNVERMDISLLGGQTLKMRISNVESTTQFYVQLPSAIKCENIVDQYMADKDTKALALPGELAAMQNQALECSLQNVTASPKADKQLKELEGTEVLIYVEEVNNSRLIVKLYDLFGNGIINIEEKISPVCVMPILSSTHNVFVSYADHPTNIWLQRYLDVDLETKLARNLQQYYINSGQNLKPEIHLLCATKYSDDSQWYRGKIISLTETTAYVNYIDYGNSEEVALDSLMVLEPQFYEPHQLGINVSLSVSLTGTEAEQKDILQTHLMSKDFVATFYNVHKKWIVDLTENGEKLSDKFRSLNLIEIEQTFESTPQPASQIHETTHGRFDVCVSHVDSPSQFWLQYMDKITALNEKQQQLQLEVSNFLTIDGILEEGTLCVAVYTIDDLWYRAEVLDADEDITTVRFIDYGNTDVIDNKASNIRQMPDDWKNLEIFAFKCRLDVIPVDTEDWSELTCERFQNIVTSVESLQALIVADTMPKRVELFIDNKSVSEMLVEEKHAIIINTEQELVNEIVDLELDPHSAFVCHINSPSEFWVQEEKSVADLEVMADRFMVADMFPKIEERKEGLLCVAKYPEDEQWYRARIVSHDNGTQVIYIDYGNSAISTEIRTIPEDLANIPPLSRKCCLELPSQVAEWSEQAREKFVKLAADGATIFLLDVLKDQETSLVKLTLDGQNVADILGNMCEQNLPVIEERLPPLGEENSPNVMVSHINCPNEFWIQAESSISELEVMSDRLRDAESFLTLNNLDVGMVCAARYPEDGYWYRAKIVGHCEEGTEVLYMDYGNSAVTEELRVLPEDIVNIPILSKLCALEKPNNIVEWSEKACNKFKELAAEGATMFQFESLDGDDPMHVRLCLNGTNVIDLLSECENIPEVIEIVETDDENIVKNNTENNIIDMEIQETMSHEYQLINDKETVLNQTDDEECINQMKKLELEVACDGLTNSNINEKCEDQQIASFSEIKENIDDSSEIKVECTSSMLKDIISAVVMEKGLDVTVRNETISNAITSIEPYLTTSSSNIKELSIDEIIENMIRNATDDLESQKIDDANLLIARKDIENLESNKVLSVTSEEQPQDTQLHTSQVQNVEQEICIKMESDANESSRYEILEMISCLPKEQINLEQIQRQNPTKNGTIPENINNDLENHSKNTDTSNADSSSGLSCPAESPIIKTEPIVVQHSHSEKQSEDILCISEGESSKLNESKTEAKCSLTPKTSHSQKIVAAVVNPYVQSVLDTNETDEVLSILEDNIPK